MDGLPCLALLCPVVCGARRAPTWRLALLCLLTRFHSRFSVVPHLIRPEEGRWFWKRMPVAPKEVRTTVALALVNCHRWAVHGKMMDGWMDA